MLLIAPIMAVLDAPYLQDISHKAVYKNVPVIGDWDLLPFNLEGKQNILFLEEQQCFVAITADTFFSASRNVNQSKLELESPFSPWTDFYSVTDHSVLKIVPSHNTMSSFYVVTEDNILAVAMAAGPRCDKVMSVKTLLDNESAGLWGSVTATTSSVSSIWVASSKRGVLQVSLATPAAFAPQPVQLDGEAVGAMLWVPEWHKLFVGTPVAMYTLLFAADANAGAAPAKVSHEWVGAIVDTVPVDMVYDAQVDALWIAESQAVHKQTADGRLWRIGQKQGAPITNITSVGVAGDVLYVGCEFGGARVSTSVSPAQQNRVAGTSSAEHGNAALVQDPWPWVYYAGNRYFPDDSVVAVVAVSGVSVTGESSALFVSATGLTLMEASRWTLREKATALGSSELHARHDRMGLVTTPKLEAFGDLSTAYPVCSDNDGLWTSMHIMSEAYRFMTTGEAQAREWAWDAFEALELMSVLPGAYPRFPARSYVLAADVAAMPAGAGCSGDPWVPSPVDPAYMWKSTTSSDEIDGHLAALPLLYDHIAQTEEEKARVYALIEGITGGILANDLYLIDPSTGEPTIWGFWNPTLVNDDPEHYSERGTNSVGILAYCASAYSITHDEKYLKTYWDLADNYDYVLNVLNSKIDCPLEDNHSDNNLLMQAYHILFYSLQRLDARDESLSKVRANVEAMVSALVPGIDRLWTIVKAEKNPLWIATYGGVAGRPVCPLAVSDATWALRHWMVDLMDWPVDNSLRWDITLSPFYPRDAKPDTPHDMRETLSPQEIATMKANKNPFAMGVNGDGMGEQCPWQWRLPYYMMVYNGLIKAV